MSYFLAVDAGGTKTTFVLADDDQILARVQSGTIKRMRTDESTASRNLHEALAKLRQASGVPLSHIAQTCIGTAGEVVPLVVDWLSSAFQSTVGGSLEIVGDVEVALDAAFRGRPGVLILAGTGSNVAGRTRSGKIVTAGGWGPQLADQGSGHFIGLEALRRGFLAIDRDNRDAQDAQRTDTDILEVAMKFWKLPSLAALVEYANARPAPDYSRLAPLIVDLALHGDTVARQVLEQGGRDLAYLAELVIARLRRLEESSGQPFALPEIAFAGSILEQIQLIRVALKTALIGTHPDIKFQPDAVDPVMGALWRARRVLSPV